MLSLQERTVFLETVEQQQKKELEEHIDVLLKMEQERLLLLRESDSLKKDKASLAETNDGYKDKLSKFEEHLSALKDEIQKQASAQQEILAQKEEQIANLKAQLETKAKFPRAASKGSLTSSQRSMTGLPKSVVKQKTEAPKELRFKRKESNEGSLGSSCS